jgi:hypothetical protein
MDSLSGATLVKADGSQVSADSALAGKVSTIYEEKKRSSLLFSHDNGRKIQLKIHGHKSRDTLAPFLKFSSTSFTFKVFFNKFRYA